MTWPITWNLLRANRTRVALAAAFLLTLVATVLAAGGCTSLSPAQRTAANAVAAAQDSYAAGDYQRTIQLLRNSNAFVDGDRSTQIDAHKLMAFSYCVTNRVAQCRSEFEAILRIDPHFELSAAEKGHPIWGPAFDAARRKVAPS
ncbi:TssQ family T6SS-associated lipoprotein [Paraburkholderia sp. CNPSo 3076]|uniref:TssQ family T6SS-associated lipoprotein n=1 Tax=Paraburkholderia sp. CNPSo 3076 TaxID=2940936 RepID=UPI002251F83F|nr:TssQ family T6SS-associated lipoprotein [Paraburkholderia sp. CNPSo 3076]MCX5544811.1 TssQ family T6SS-associated lipoprotein [Paraburkholderia sp. CNPSo 3076]